MQSFFFIRTDNQCVKVNFSDIAYIEAKRNYVRIVGHQRAHMVLLSLKQLEAILPNNSFCRIQRSYIVSLDAVVSFDQECVYVQVGPGQKKATLPIGQNYKKFLHQKVKVVASPVRPKLKQLIGEVALN